MKRKLAELARAIAPKRKVAAGLIAVVLLRVLDRLGIEIEAFGLDQEAVELAVAFGLMWLVGEPSRDDRDATAPAPALSGTITSAKLEAEAWPSAVVRERTDRMSGAAARRARPQTGADLDPDIAARVQVTFPTFVEALIARNRLREDITAGVPETLAAIDEGISAAGLDPTAFD